MTISETLIAARALIDAPDKWHKGGYGDEEKGCFCLWASAIQANPLISSLTHEAMREALPKGFGSTVEFNDYPDTTHADVMALFDRAIAQAQADEAIGGVK